MSRNMYKGPMDKAKEGEGLRVWWGKVVAGRWRQLYLNNNKKEKKKLEI